MSGSSIQGNDASWIKNLLRCVDERKFFLAAVVTWCTIHALLIFVAPFISDLGAGTKIPLIGFSVISILASWLLPIGAYDAWREPNTGQLSTLTLLIASISSVALLNPHFVIGEDNLSREEVRDYYIVLASLAVVIFTFQLFRIRISTEIRRVGCSVRREDGDARSALPGDLLLRAASIDDRDN